MDEWAVVTLPAPDLTRPADMCRAAAFDALAALCQGSSSACEAALSGGHLVGALLQVGEWGVVVRGGGATWWCMCGCGCGEVRCCLSVVPQGRGGSGSGRPQVVRDNARMGPRAAAPISGRRLCQMLHSAVPPPHTHTHQHYR